ncbi:MAG TPA: EscU/YscU/HrcU family type III secretion system export apparatus switch protein, partial [candidate division Zixibacteria bacterium]
PTVVAKGERLLAEKIKEVAIEYDVPIVEDRPLERAPYKAVKIGMEIPANLYRAVAEVLAYVYGLKRRTK